MASKIFGAHPIAFRHVQASQVPANSNKTDFETSYQNAYFEQTNAPRGCSTKTNERPKVCRAPPSTIASVMQSANTTAGDCVSNSQASYRIPTEGLERPRIDKRTDPKGVATVFPVGLPKHVGKVSR